MVVGIRPVTMDMFESSVDIRRTTLYFLPRQHSRVNKIHKIHEDKDGDGADSMDLERERGITIASAVIRAICSKTWEGGGISATNVNFRYRMIRKVYEVDPLL